MVFLLGKSVLGEGTLAGENVIVGYPTRDELKSVGGIEDLGSLAGTDGIEGAKIGGGCVLRDFTIVYSKTEIGNDFQTGHYTLIREESRIGAGSLVGTNSIVENKCQIGDNVSIQSGVYIPTNTVVEDNVFIGPYASFTNDKYMGRGKVELIGAKVEQGARIGSNSTILPGVKIGRDSLVASGAVVTRDVPPYKMVAGIPARVMGDVPEEHRKY